MKVERIYEIPALPFINEMRVRKLGEISDVVLNSLAFKWKFDAIYLMGVWKKSEMSTHNHRAPKNKNATSSPFAVREYSVAKNLGGKASLIELKKKLNERGVKLLLDFVPNHTARDHEWIRKNSDFYLQDNKIEFGRSSKFEFWPDTAQLDYSNQELVKIQLDILESIKPLCDGLRCDMSHLILSDVFEKQWGRRPKKEFWSEVRKKLGKNFYLMGEAYGRHEYRLVELGFDSVYDKEDGFYDRLLTHFAGENPELLEAHIRGCNSTKVQTPTGEKIFGDCLVRFLENHDEKRAAKVFGVELENALKIMLKQYGDSHGVLFFNHGQLEGRTIKHSLFSKVFPREKVNPKILTMYERLLGVEKNWEAKVPRKFQLKIKK